MAGCVRRFTGTHGCTGMTFFVAIIFSSHFPMLSLYWTVGSWGVKPRVAEESSLQPPVRRRSQGEGQRVTSGSVACNTNNTANVLFLYCSAARPGVGRKQMKVLRRPAAGRKIYR